MLTARSPDASNPIARNDPALADVMAENVQIRPCSTCFWPLTLSAETGRSNSGLKNRLARAAKMIGVKPITAAKTSRPALPNSPALKSA